ncbi:hypothetical protein QBC45DRAFT_415695, partial [Copromyces sp. CBS 386.78]
MLCSWMCPGPVHCTPISILSRPSGPCSFFLLFFLESSSLFLIVLVGSLEKVGACEADHRAADGDRGRGRGNKARECSSTLLCAASNPREPSHFVQCRFLCIG